MWATGEWIGANCRILYISGVSFSTKAIYEILMLFYDSLHGDMSFPYTVYCTTQFFFRTHEMLSKFVVSIFSVAHIAHSGRTCIASNPGKISFNVIQVIL